MRLIGDRKGATGVPDPPPEARPVPGFPGYAAGWSGKLWRYARPWKRWVELKTDRRRNGHLHARLVVDGRAKVIDAGVVVLLAWIGPRPEGCEAYHFPDPDPANCRVDNLRWARRGTSRVGKTGPKRLNPRKGDEHRGARLSAAKVPRIRTLYREGFEVDEIAALFGVGRETVRLVLSGKTWAHVPDPAGPVVMRPAGVAGEDHPGAKLDREKVSEIRRRAEAAGGKPDSAALGREFGVTPRRIRQIIRGNAWKDVAP